MTPEHKKLIEQYYNILPNGTVISKVGQNAGTVLKMKPGHKCPRGYPAYSLTLRRESSPQKKTTIPVHTLLATFFIPNPEDKPFVNHKNGDKEDFRLENLEWVTERENHLHAFRIGLRSNKGEAHPRAKLTEAQVHEICANYKPGMAYAKWQAINRGKASRSTLEMIFYGRQWVHVSMRYGITPKVRRVSVKNKPPSKEVPKHTRTGQGVDKTKDFKV